MDWSGPKIPTQIWDQPVEGRSGLFVVRDHVTTLVTCLAIVAALAVAIFEFLQIHISWLPLAFAGGAAALAALLLLVHYRRHRVLESAVATMWQGLAVFDAQGRLVLHNSQFCALLGLANGAVQRAATHRGIVELLIEAGCYEGRSAEGVWSADAAFVSRRQEALDYIDFPGRRTIAQSHAPLADGGWVRTYADVTRRRQVEARIVHLAHHDALTDLPNRALFRERLEDALANAGDRRGVALMLLDLIRFKDVNDGFGHAVGDRLLIMVADRVRREVGATVTLARLGGDEFAIIQPGIAGLIEARELAARILEACGPAYEINGSTLSVGVSIGISFAPVDGVEAETLLKRADEAMYRAKSEAKSAYTCFCDGPPAVAASV